MRRSTLQPCFCLFLVVAGLAACGPAATDPGPGGVTVEEAQALDKAAEELEAELADPPLVPGEKKGE